MCVFALTMLTVEVVGFAQDADLTRIMPDDTLVYAGWSGWDHERVAAKDTAFGKTLADPQVKRFLEGVWTAGDVLLKRVAAESQRGPAYEAGKRLLINLSRRPSALAVLDLGLAEQGPYAQVVLVCDVGEGDESFLKDFQTLLHMADLPPTEPVTVAGKPMQQLPLPAPGGVYYGVVDGLFILAVGQDAVAEVVRSRDDGPASLATNPNIKTARTKIGGNERTRAATVYLDIAGLHERLEMLLPVITHGDTEKADVINNIVGLLGLDGLEALTWEPHHRDGGCYHAAYVQAKSDRGDVFALHSKVNLTGDDLAVIPKDVTWASAFNLDLGAAYRHVLSIVKSLDSRSTAEVDQTIAELQENLGFHLEEDFINLLGDTFVIFDAPENGGLWFTGITAVVESADPQRLGTSLKKIVQTIAAQIDKASVTVSSCEHGKHRIEFVNVAGVPMPVAPAWSAHGNRVIFGLYPQMVMTTLDRLSAGLDPADTILGHPDFVRARRVLGAGAGVTFVNGKKGFEDLYGLSLPLLQAGAAMAQGEGVAVDISLFPTQEALTRHLFANVTISRTDEHGVLLASYGPGPFAVPSFNAAGGVQVPLVASILLPSLSRARELSKRLVSAANLKGIGTCCHIYAADHDGQFPQDLQTLLADGCITEKQLKSPKHKRGRPCYIYIAGQNADTSDPGNVLAHERRDLNRGEGVNVLFVDGRVEFLKMDAFEQVQSNTRRRLEGQ